jgi:hypothetical protein
MSRLTYIFFTALMAIICFAKPQFATACVTPGFDEFATSGCGDSPCSTQDCSTSGSGGQHSPLQNLFVNPIPFQSRDSFLVARLLTSAPSSDSIYAQTDTDSVHPTTENKALSPNFGARGTK